MTPPEGEAAAPAPSAAPAAAPVGGSAPPAAGSAPPAGGGAAPAAAAPGPGNGTAPPAGNTNDVAWPTNWRETYAGEDKGKLSTLARYATPKDALDSMFTARGDLQKLMAQVPPGKDATPEQKVAYRTAQGVPDKPEGYFDKIDKAITFGDADKPVIMQYLTKAHERGDTPGQVAENLAIYHQASLAAVQHMQTSDAAAKTAFEGTMRQQLGGEYDENMGRFQALLDSSFPAEMKQALMNARLGDDKATPLMLSPGFVKSMITLAREMNPMNTALPPGGIQKVDAVADQLKAYEKRMGGQAWHKDTKAQEHYQQLVTYYNKTTGKEWGKG